jgi:hypothetical protein
MNTYEARRKLDAAMVRRRERPAPVTPIGAQPVECKPMRRMASIEASQVLDCARRRECLSFAVAREWAAWTCAYCPVRETAARVEPGVRRESMAVTEMPSVGKI